EIRRGPGGVQQIDRPVPQPGPVGCDGFCQDRRELRVPKGISEGRRRLQTNIEVHQDQGLSQRDHEALEGSSTFPQKEGGQNSCGSTSVQSRGRSTMIKRENFPRMGRDDQEWQENGLEVLESHFAGSSLFLGLRRYSRIIIENLWLSVFICGYMAFPSAWAQETPTPVVTDIDLSAPSTTVERAVTDKPAVLSKPAGVPT